MGKDNTEKMLEIFGRLKREKNGVVTDAMRDRGVEYGMNYGVSIPVIRRIARGYSPDHELAMFLFRQDVRELKLAAVYVDDPSMVTREQVEEWERGLANSELAEHVSMFLFSASPMAYDIALRWLGSDDSFLNKGGLHIAGRMAFSGRLTETEAEGLLPLVESVVTAAKPYIHNAAIYALRNLAGATDKVHGLVAGMKISSERAVAAIAEEVEALSAD